MHLDKHGNKVTTSKSFLLSAVVKTSLVVCQLKQLTSETTSSGIQKWCLPFLSRNQPKFPFIR